MDAAFDIVVVGCGGIGSSILCHAALQGKRVLGIDQFHPPHARGSSHGQTRIIRQAYFEHPDYVPLLLDAYEDWYRLESAIQQQLMITTGLLQAGPSDGIVVPGVLNSAKQHGLDVEYLSRIDLQKRFPMFEAPQDHEGAFEAKAGYLKVESCVQAHLDLARIHGAETWFDTQVLGHESRDAGIVFKTSRGAVRADRAVIAPGSWAQQWFDPNSPVLYRVLRKHLYWFQPSSSRWDISEGCPLFLFENDKGCFYGFPRLDEKGLKIAEHSGGELVLDPSQVDTSLDSSDLKRTQDFTKDTFGEAFPLLDHQVCMYTMTNDQNFIIDQHPSDSRMLIASGFSGHGFKFASVLGRLLVEWLSSGIRDRRLEFLRLNR